MKVREIVNIIFVRCTWLHIGYNEKITLSGCLLWFEFFSQNWKAGCKAPSNFNDRLLTGSKRALRSQSWEIVPMNAPKPTHANFANNPLCWNNFRKREGLSLTQWGKEGMFLWIKNEHGKVVVWLKLKGYVFEICDVVRKRIGRGECKEAVIKRLRYN